MKSLAMRLIGIFFIVSFLTFMSLVSIAAIDDGTQGEGIIGFITVFVSKLFYIFRFPTHTLFFEGFSSGKLFFIGLAINIVFWTTSIYFTTKYLKK